MPRRGCCGSTRSLQNSHLQLILLFDSRFISLGFAKEKMNVIGVQTQSVKGSAWMTFTVEVADSARLARVLHTVADVPGVHWARRR